MGEEIKTWLFDILNAIDEIESFIEVAPKTLEEYQKDLRTKRAIERNLEIIGEAVSRILKAEPNFNLPDARLIVGTRNRIIHGYDSVSDELIWSIVTTHLPQLKTEISRMLD